MIVGHLNERRSAFLGFVGGQHRADCSAILSVSLSLSFAIVEVKSSLPSGMQSLVGPAGEQRGGGGGEGGEYARILNRLLSVLAWTCLGRLNQGGAHPGNSV